MAGRGTDFFEPMGTSYTHGEAEDLSDGKGSALQRTEHRGIALKLITHYRTFGPFGPLEFPC